MDSQVLTAIAGWVSLPNFWEMSWQQILTIIAGVVFVAGFLPYAYDILWGDTRPTIATWIIWSSLDVIAFVGMYLESSVNGQIVGALIGGWSVVILVLKYGQPGWSRLDTFCLAGAIIGVVLLFVFPVLSIVATQAVIFFGSIPTFASAWNNPNRENKTAWGLWWISCLFAVSAIPRWTPEHYAQPVTFFVVESVMVCILLVFTERVKRFLIRNPWQTFLVVVIIIFITILVVGTRNQEAADPDIFKRISRYDFTIRFQGGDVRPIVNREDYFDPKRTGIPTHLIWESQKRFGDTRRLQIRYFKLTEVSQEEFEKEATQSRRQRSD